jgi:glucose-6-phosphate isomerase, archaeal
MIDLTAQAGFPLLLDPGTLEVITPGEISFTRETRRIGDLRAILHEPSALSDTTPVYWNYKLKDAGSAEPVITELRLTFGLVCLPPLKIGREYVKTHGHYHSVMPGSEIAFPEVYTHFYGEIYLYMQRRKKFTTIALDDCVIYRMIPGHSIMIPPGYAHILINPSSKPALTAGLYAREALHDYDPIRKTAGGAYYFIQQEAEVKVIPNRRYPKPPPLREIVELNGTRFASPVGNQPLWSTFIQDPQSFAFITNPQLATLQFLYEDQTI